MWGGLHAHEVLKLEVAALQVVLDAAGRAHDNVTAAAQNLFLRRHRRSAVQAHCAQIRRPPDVLEICMHLLESLASHRPVWLHGYSVGSCASSQPVRDGWKGVLLSPQCFSLASTTSLLITACAVVTQIFMHKGRKVPTSAFGKFQKPPVSCCPKHTHTNMRRDRLSAVLEPPQSYKHSSDDKL